MSRRTTTGIVVALMALAALLRAPGLDSGLWFDEIVTLVDSVRLPVRDLLTAFPGNNNHPLYSLLAHVSIGALGDHPWTLRLPAVVFGVAAIPALYRVGAAVTTRGEALLATLLMAVSYHAVWFSQNARGYTALLFFTLIATLLFVRLIQRPDRRMAFAYGVVAGLGMYTHLTMAFTAAAHAAIWGWHAWRDEEPGRAEQLRVAILSLATTALVSGLLYLPMAGQVYQVLTGPRQAAASVATSQWAALEALRGLRIGFGTLGLFAVVVLVALGAASYLKRRPEILFLFVLPGLITGAAMVTLHAPMRPRFFFSLLGFGLLLLVRGAFEAVRLVPTAAANDRGVDVFGAAVIGLIAAVSIWSLGYNYRYPKQDYDGALRFIQNHRSASEPVITAGLTIFPYDRYYRMPWTPVEHAEQLERLRATKSRLWVTYAFPEYMEPALVDSIHRNCTGQAVFPGTLGGGEIVVCSIGHAAD